jgi:hypothetical protein
MPITFSWKLIDEVPTSEPGQPLRVLAGGDRVLITGPSLFELDRRQALDLVHALTTAEHALRQQDHANRVVTDTLGPEVARQMCDLHGLDIEPCYWCSDEGADGGVRR